MQILIHPLQPRDMQDTIRVITRGIHISQKSIYSAKLRKILIQKYTLEKFRKKAQEVSYLIAKIDQEIVGVIGLKGHEVRTFFVDPDYQGKGVERALYNELELTARKQGLNKLIVDASPLGEPIYIKLGFTKKGTKTKEYDGGTFTDAYMEKELNKED